MLYPAASNAVFSFPCATRYSSVADSNASKPVTAPAAAVAIPPTVLTVPFRAVPATFPSLESPLLKPDSSISVPIFTVPSFANDPAS